MIDLHLHLDGSLPVQELPRLAEMGNTMLPSQEPQALKKLLCVGPGCTSLAEYLEKFDLPLQVLQTAPALELAGYSLVKQLAQQGLCYAELRFAPQSHTRKGMGQQQAVQAVLRGVQRASAEFDFLAQLILCCMRGAENQKENQETVELAAAFLGQGVCAVDLAGAEAAYPNEGFREVFRQAQKLGVPVVIHAGEAAGPQSVRSALEMGAVRIGHGIRAAQDPALVQELARRGTALESCYTSNLQTKAVNGPQEYPLQQMLQLGVRMTVNTDNMTVSDTTLRQEYLLLGKLYGFGEEELLGLALNGVQAALLPEEKKAAVRKRVLSGFHHWICKKDT